MVDYKRKPVLWIEGTRCLSNPERGVYADLVERMYALESDLYYDERDLAGFCNVTLRSFRKILQGLIDKGKIHVTEDGKLTANHVRTERETAMNIRETYRSRAVRGGKRSGEVRKNNSLTEACASSSPSPSPSPSIKKESLQDSKESTQPLAAQPPDPLPPCKPKSRKGTRLPEDWQAGLEEYDYARGRGFTDAEIADIAEDFKVHWTEGNGRNKTHANWLRCWQGWIRRQAPRPGSAVNGNAAHGNRQGDGGLAAAVRNVRAKLGDSPRPRSGPDWRSD